VARPDAGLAHPAAPGEVRKRPVALTLGDPPGEAAHWTAAMKAKAQYCEIGPPPQADMWSIAANSWVARSFTTLSTSRRQDVSGPRFLLAISWSRHTVDVDLMPTVCVRISDGRGVIFMTFSERHLQEAREIIDAIDVAAIERMVSLLVQVRDAGGRLFFLGVGGSAGNCSHAVNDFRKIVGIEAYAPTDNVSELTARTNDEGWETVFVEWLKTSRLKPTDALFIFSVGGGNLEKNVSPNLVRALQYAKEIGAKVLGVVGRDGGYTAKVGDAVSIVPTVNPDAVTPHSEAFQAVIWHLLVSHPLLKTRQTKWEGTR
jgi:D-sedoheptulose 7-phosphate isomerase